MRPWSTCSLCVHDSKNNRIESNRLVNVGRLCVLGLESWIWFGSSGQPGSTTLSSSASIPGWNVSVQCCLRVYHCGSSDDTTQYGALRQRRRVRSQRQWRIRPKRWHKPAHVFVGFARQPRLPFRSSCRHSSIRFGNRHELGRRTTVQDRRQCFVRAEGNGSTVL